MPAEAGIPNFSCCIRQPSAGSHLCTDVLLPSLFLSAERTKCEYSPRWQIWDFQTVFKSSWMTPRTLCGRRSLLFPRVYGSPLIFSVGQVVKLSSYYTSKFFSKSPSLELLNWAERWVPLSLENILEWAKKKKKKKEREKKNQRSSHLHGSPQPCCSLPRFDVQP